MGHMAQLRKLMGVSDDMHKVRMSSSKGSRLSPQHEAGQQVLHAARPCASASAPLAQFWHPSSLARILLAPQRPAPNMDCLVVSAPLVLLQQYLEQIKADPEVCAISGQPPPPKKQRITPPGTCVVAAGGCCFDCRAAWVQFAEVVPERTASSQG